MNKSQNDAIRLAQRIEEAQRLAQQANKHSYNWLPFVRLFSWVNDPKDIAEDLLYVYFEFTALLAEKGQDYGLQQERLSAGLFHLRSVYEALQDMTNKEEALLQIIPIEDLR